MNKNDFNAIVYLYSENNDTQPQSKGIGFYVLLSKTFQVPFFLCAYLSQTYHHFLRGLLYDHLV